MRTPHRLPSLDGIRALSIALVIVAHSLNTPGLEVPHAVYFRLNLGRLGVQIFMALSGFLITTLLLSERRRGPISLRRFYLRRAFRIFPAYYSFVLALAVGRWAGVVAVDDSDLLSASLFLSGYDMDRAWAVGHLWSITVEEQFYLLWPPILAWWGVAGARRALIGCVILAPALRVGLWWLRPEWQPLVHEGFPWVMDTLATGCALALYRDQIHRWPALERLQRHPWTPLGWLTLAVVITYQWYQHTAFYAVGLTALNVCVVLFIDGALRSPTRGLGPLLNARPMAAVGVMSYSLYLWQQVFIDRHSAGAIHAFPWSLLATVACAWISYRLIEAPALGLRRRLMDRSPRG